MERSTYSRTTWWSDHGPNNKRLRCWCCILSCHRIAEATIFQSLGKPIGVWTSLFEKICASQTGYHFPQNSGSNTIKSHWWVATILQKHLCWFKSPSPWSVWSSSPTFLWPSMWLHPTPARIQQNSDPTILHPQITSHNCKHGCFQK